MPLLFIHSNGVAGLLPEEPLTNCAFFTMISFLGGVHVKPALKNDVGESANVRGYAFVANDRGTSDSSTNYYVCKRNREKG